MITMSAAFTEPYIVLPMRAADRSTAIQELLEPLEKNHVIDSSHECLESILKRERRMSTGIGKGVALPHGLSKNLQEVAMVLGISPEGIDFNAVDGALCHIFVLLISPAQEPDKHLKLLSRLSKYLSDSEQRSALVDATTSEQVLEILRVWEAAEEEDVTI
jgi:mannitol/fructose-specific phosphotransferase system IIA component (Ntr-type)